MWCTRLAENAGHKKGCKNWPFVHHCTTLSGYIFATKARIDNREITCNSNISSTCPHIGFVSWFVTAATSVNKVKQTLHDVWPSPWLVYCIYILGGLLPPNGILLVQNSICIKVLHSLVLAALRYCTAWYKEWNFGTFAPHHFQQRAPPIYRGRAAITLGIGPHSSLCCFMLTCNICFDCSL